MTIQELQNLLKSKPVVYINVNDTLGNSIDSNVYYKTLEAHKNDVSVYLATYANKYDKVVIIPRSRNGSSSKPVGKPFTVILQNNSNTDSKAQTAVVTKAVKNDKMDVNGFMGLNAPQILDAFSSQRENTLLKEQLRTINQELTTTKGERDALRNENYDLKRKTDLYEHDKEHAKPSAIDKILESIASNPSLLTTFAGVLGNRAGGLNATTPAPQSTGLQGSKALLMKYAEEHPEEFCTFYTQVINKLNTDEEFATAIKNLLNPTK